MEPLATVNPAVQGLKKLSISTKIASVRRCNCNSKTVNLRVSLRAESNHPTFTPLRELLSPISPCWIYFENCRGRTNLETFPDGRVE